MRAAAAAAALLLLLPQRVSGSALTARAASDTASDAAVSDKPSYGTSETPPSSTFLFCDSSAAALTLPAICAGEPKSLTILNKNPGVCTLSSADGIFVSSQLAVDSLTLAEGGFANLVSGANAWYQFGGSDGFDCDGALGDLAETVANLADALSTQRDSVSQMREALAFQRDTLAQQREMLELQREALELQKEALGSLQQAVFCDANGKPQDVACGRR
mmetsp:Transcript_16077/g.57172  ORF Transcript_16077/g.57172 Transcript_16077/m.57172 type:complete len:218 (-) Transcript_16077:282-935(-)